MTWSPTGTNYLALEHLELVLGRHRGPRSGRSGASSREDIDVQFQVGGADDPRKELRSRRPGRSELGSSTRCCQGEYIRQVTLAARVDVDQCGVELRGTTVLTADPAEDGRRQARADQDRSDTPDRRRAEWRLSPEQPVVSAAVWTTIAVVTRLTEMHPRRTLRECERAGLLKPSRQAGGPARLVFGRRRRPSAADPISRRDPWPERGRGRARVIDGRSSG